MASVLDEPGEETLTGPMTMCGQPPAWPRGIRQGGAHPTPGRSGIPDREPFEESP